MFSHSYVNRKDKCADHSAKYAGPGSLAIGVNTTAQRKLTYAHRLIHTPKSSDLNYTGYDGRGKHLDYGFFSDSLCFLI